MTKPALQECADVRDMLGLEISRVAHVAKITELAAQEDSEWNDVTRRIHNAITELDAASTVVVNIAGRIANASH